jgi:AraC-like DNA-binding protein
MAMTKDYPEAIHRLVLAAVHITMSIYVFTHVELQLKAHRERIKNDFSYHRKVNMNWFQIPVILIILCFALNFVFAFTSSMELRMVYNFIFFVLHAAWCVYVSIQSDVYYIPASEGVKPLFEQPAAAALFVPPGSERPKISQIAFDTIREGLNELLEKREIYCQPDLRLDDLAVMLNTNKTYVSLVINESYHTNFYTIINQYRVKKAAQILEEKKMQIKEVWMQSGFNSQTSFNALFRKEMGMTPVEWAKGRIKNED